MRLTVTMPGPELYVARVEPYRLSDLEKWLKSIEANPLVEITPIGKTVEGRGLEIVRVGRPDAPYRVFLRARAHPWEPGGNWVVQGLVHRLLKGDDEAKRYLERYCVYVLPMANKDGVARGRTRFNLRGKDLNRNWDKPADPRARAGEPRPGDLAGGDDPARADARTWLELHNDGNGQLHVSRPPVAELERLPRPHEDAGGAAPRAHVVHRGEHERGVPERRDARRGLAGALRHRRGRPRAQRQLDRRPEGLPLGRATGSTTASSLRVCFSSTSPSSSHDRRCRRISDRHDLAVCMTGDHGSNSIAIGVDYHA